MGQLNLQRKRASFLAIPKLKCPYCLRSPLLKQNSWFEFREGCPTCQYRYDREPGYFWGAPWMINYPITGIFTLFLLYTFYRADNRLHVLWIATIVSAAAIIFAVLFYPFARAIWLVGDHWLHPLTEEDALQPAADKVLETN